MLTLKVSSFHINNINMKIKKKHSRKEKYISLYHSYTKKIMSLLSIMLSLCFVHFMSFGKL